MTKVLLVDLFNVAFRGMHVHKNMEYHGEQTGGLYGFCNILFSNILKHKPDHIIFAKDGKKTKNVSYEDASLNSLNLLYKANRKPSLDRDYINTTLSLIDTFIAKSAIGGVMQQDNIEADEIIHWYCNAILPITVSQNQNEVIILSNDSDLYSLLKYQVVKVQTHKDLITRDMYEEMFGFFPNYHNCYLALSGGHNNLPHPKGVGNKTAIKLIKGAIEYGDVTKYLSTNLGTENYEIYKKTFHFINNDTGWLKDQNAFIPTTTTKVGNRFEGEDYLISKGIRLATTKKVFDWLSAVKMIEELEGGL